VFDGVAIYNTLLRNDARVIVDVDGIAASIASIIAMAGNEINIAANGFMMIHDPWTVAMGTANDLREQADVMDKVRGTLLDTYMLRATVERDEVSDKMAAETWLTADEAVELGLADSMTEEVKLAACGKKEFIAKFQHLPEPLKEQPKDRLQNSKQTTARMAQSLRKFKL